MTNATADTIERTETVPPSHIATRSTFFCDEVKRRSHFEKGLSCFIYASVRTDAMSLLLPRAKTWVPRRSRVPTAASSGNHKKSPRFRSFENPRDQYDEHEDHAEQRDGPAEPRGDAVDILLR